MFIKQQIVRVLLILVSAWISACAPVGPDFVRPDIASNASWSDFVREDFHFEPQDSAEWWGIFGDPVLNQLVAAGRRYPIACDRLVVFNSGRRPSLN